MRPTISDNKPSYLVSWAGYPGEDTTEPRDNIAKDVPNIANRFEREFNVVFFQSKNNKWELDWTG